MLKMYLMGWVTYNLFFCLFDLLWCPLMISVTIVTTEEKEVTNLRESKVGVYGSCREERERGNDVIIL